MLGIWKIYVSKFTSLVPSLFSLPAGMGPPDSSVDKFDLFEGLVGRMDAEGLEYHILGNMNVNVNSPNSDSNLRLLTDIAHAYGLQQLINEPTRVTNSPPQ